MRTTRLTVLALLLAPTALAQTPTDPFPTPIPATDGVIRVRFTEFASIPDIGAEAARMMLLVDEPGTRRMFVNDMRGPLYTYGVRNPQRFGWDPRNGNLFVADIGQNIVEELSVAGRGANLGWNKWEGSFPYLSREAVDLTKRRADPGVTYPVVEYGQLDPLLQANSAVTGVHVYRHDTIAQLANLVLFGDFPSGEIFYIHADKLPRGGQDAIRRILLDDGGESKTLLKLIQEKNVKQGKPPATRADLRFGAGPDGRVFLLNKHDGTIRLLVPSQGSSHKAQGTNF